MQRNMDLVRTILMRMEDSASGRAAQGFGIQGFSPAEIGYHVYIMMQEGLIEGSDVTGTASTGLPQAIATRLTWKGHEFLDLAGTRSGGIGRGRLSPGSAARRSRFG